jgi:hypothetical protein
MAGRGWLDAPAGLNHQSLKEVLLIRPVQDRFLNDAAATDSGIYPPRSLAGFKS